MAAAAVASLVVVVDETAFCDDVDFDNRIKSCKSSLKNENASLVEHTRATSSGNNFRRFCNCATLKHSFPSFAVMSSDAAVISSVASLDMPLTSGSNLQIFRILATGSVRLASDDDDDDAAASTGPPRKSFP
eukprot:CAMPEP_0118708822 /NCGR_PEP_ID=MMETSP0800-20121206/22184_1 /TAXON_ID=210618 ORGANISM="Striatella unipunctata, Strain CCMP2910" /NCGR_SAMPLE_ID=MMETSP0800 /ASSEMBLY_ACC=CAM_ASM_000638 /LENGTH=131 /DNA_ID=CAMNT_0006612225 /DNA_START=64 /DNA_END=459 /DNA_ORIENTATION=+